MISCAREIISFLQLNLFYEKQFVLFKGGGKIFTFLLIILFSATLYISCKKESALERGFKEQNSMQSVTSREVFLVTKSWLTVFQQDLNAASNATSLSTTYTPIQMVDGVEALINIAAGVNSDYQAHRTKKSLFQVNLVDNRLALKSIYEQAYQSYLAHKASLGESAVPISIMVEIDSVKNGTAFISTKSILGINNVCFIDRFTLNSSQPCATAFDANEGFFVGGGDEELELVSIYTNPMCNYGCGSIAPCTMGPTTAYEAIEERINYNYLANNIPVAPAGYYFAGFSNIDFIYNFPLDNELQNCNLSNQEVGTCLIADLSDPLNPIDPLNCMYCQLYSAIEDNEEPYVVPAGYHFISLNLAIDYCLCGADNICEAFANKLYSKYYFGKPIFKKKIVPSGPSDPKLVNLDEMIF